MLRLYWVEFVDPAEYECCSVSKLGIGATAANDLDALAMVRERFFPDRQAAPASRVTIISDLDGIEQSDVRPNIGNHLRRGIWFPA